MPLYELSLIIRPGLKDHNLRDFLKKTAESIWSYKGTVRGFTNSKECGLPYPMKRHQQYFARGKHLLVHFDSNPAALSDLGNKIKVDPRIIRHTFIKLGSHMQTTSSS